MEARVALNIYMNVRSWSSLDVISKLRPGERIYSLAPTRIEQMILTWPGQWDELHVDINGYHIKDGLPTSCSGVSATAYIRRQKYVLMLLFWSIVSDSNDTVTFGNQTTTFWTYKTRHGNTKEWNLQVLARTKSMTLGPVNHHGLTVLTWRVPVDSVDQRRCGTDPRKKVQYRLISPCANLGFWS